MSRMLMFALVGAAAPAAAGEAVTYTKHVAPILFRQCVACHRPGEVAPFGLLSYRDAARRADQLAEVTAARLMPPWKAEQGHGDFRDARVLTDEEKTVFSDWAKAGAPEGDPRDLPPAPQFIDDWPLGKPDLVLRMKDAVEVPADGPDQIRVIPLPTGLTEDKMLVAVDFRPGNRAVVHHAIVAVDEIGLMQGLAQRGSPPRAPGAGGGPAPRGPFRGGGGPGFGPFRGGGPGAGPPVPPRAILELFRPGGRPAFSMLGGWVPGGTPQFIAEGFGMPLGKDAKLVLQMHYHPVGKPATDRSEVALYFAGKPGARAVHTLAMAGLPLSIPAGEKRHRVRTSFTVPIETAVHSVSPHMHQLGREMKVEAVLPDGGRKPLVWIRDWDWNWQGRYVYREPVTLPAGTRIELEAFYDNSADNPANPNSPPKAVYWGEQTTDEMCLLFLQVSTAGKDGATALQPAMMMQRLQEGGLPGLLPRRER